MPFGVVDGPHQAGTDRLREPFVVDVVALGEAFAGLLGGERAGELLAGDAELAGGAVEGRERELLGQPFEAAAVFVQGRGLQGLWLFSGV